MSTSDFYLRYYVGHKGKFGHEFLEFEFRPDGEFCFGGISKKLAFLCVCYKLGGCPVDTRPRLTQEPGKFMPSTSVFPYVLRSVHLPQTVINGEVKTNTAQCASLPPLVPPDKPVFNVFFTEYNIYLLNI